MKETKIKKAEAEQKVEFQLRSSVVRMPDIMWMFLPRGWSFVCHVLYPFEA